MRTAAAQQRAMASVLVLLVVSCSATRHSGNGPTGRHDLGRYVLFVERAQNGQVTHTWKPLEDFDLTSYQHAVSRAIRQRGIVRVSAGREKYCSGRRQQCEGDCLSSSRPMPVGHLRYPTYRGPWRVNRGWWCPQSCGVLEDMCNRGMGEWAEDHAVEFDEIEPAVDWIKNHREEILVGTIVVIAGIAFVAAVAASGGGALVLVPLVVLAENTSGLPATTWIAESSR